MLLPGTSGPGGLESLDVTVSYKQMGHTFVRKTMWMNLPDERLVLQFTAPEAEFEKLYKSFRRTVFSWNRS